MKRGFLCLIYASVLFFLSSCSVSKFIPDGSYLLDEVKIVSDQKEVKSSSFKSYVRQTPNAKWFSLLKVPMYTYSLSGKDSAKWINKFFRKIGDKPVIYSPEEAERSRIEMRKALSNLGYLGGEVELSVRKNKNRVKLFYRFKTGVPYRVKSIRYEIPDRKIAGYVAADSVRSLLYPGMLFDTNVLDAERQRITDHLLNQGYYKFNKDYIAFVADTVENTFQVDLMMRVLPYRNPLTSAAEDHRQYTLRKISFVTDYDVLKSPALSSVEINDSVRYKDYQIYFNDQLFLRPRVLADNNRMTPGDLYRESDVQNTYNNFGRLRALKYTNIRFREIQENDSSRLDGFIMLTKGKIKSVSAELEGTNSAGDLGVAASLSFQHRNVFRGSETLTLKVRGAYEAITGLQGYNNDNYTEYGVEASLNFPSFMFPFLSADFKRRIRATSEVGIQFNSQIRPEFSRRIASASWSYKWIKHQKAQHKVDLIDINYIYMPWISEKFKHDYLDSIGNRNYILKYNYENLLIMRMGYSFSYNSAGGAFMGKAMAANSYSIRANIESAGNLLYGISNLFKMRKSEDGLYSILNIAYAQYVKGDFDFSKNFTIDRRNSFVFHVGLGVAVPYGNSVVLPFEKRYFSGGANSVRGWAVRTLGPGGFKGNDANIDFINQSGDIKLDLNVEYRTHLFWKLHGAAFVDAGNIWTIREYEGQPGGAFKWNRFYKQIAVAYGLGVRFDFDFFVIRFDGGMKAVNPVYTSGRERYPLIHPNFKRDFAFHFAVGYPF